MDKHRTALALALSAILLGLSGDLLLRWIPIGLNVPMWIALVITLSLVCAARSDRKLALFPVVGALIAAAGIAWRDSEVLRVLDMLLLVAFVPMLALRARGVRLASAGVSEVGLAIATTGVQTVAGFPQLVFADITWSEMPRRGTLRAGGVAARGFVIATPALVLFAALLMAADAQFSELMRGIFLFNLRDAIAHLIFTIGIAAICAGFLRSVFFSGAMPRIPRPSFLRLPAAEMSIALALVNLLFATFVIVQFRYFFLITNPASLSQYARRGFFELVAVVALVLPMLLIAEWLVDEKTKLFRILSAAQVALVLAIAASAWRRMQLYRDEFGLTQLRLYTTAFMIWLAVLLLWLVATVLTGRRNRFALGVFTSAVLAVVALHAINPDALIVETNLARAAVGRRAFDASYALRLSDDALPVIVAHRDQFPPDSLHAFLGRQRTIGWRTWNYSRAKAIDYVSNASGR
jgi:uncharacterized protein DUF4153